MDLNEYVKNVLLTESKIEKIDDDNRIPFLILLTITSFGDFIDLYKKQRYYKKEISPNDIVHEINKTIVYLEQLKRLFDYKLTKDQTLLHGIQCDVDEISNTRLFHTLLGIISEGGEIASNLATTDGNDRVNLLEEIGDILWYLAIAVDELDGNFDKILQANITKLAKRYKEKKFTTEEAINRATDAERTVLERYLDE